MARLGSLNVCSMSFRSSGDTISSYRFRKGSMDELLWLRPSFFWSICLSTAHERRVPQSFGKQHRSHRPTFLVRTTMISLVHSTTLAMVARIRCASGRRSRQTETESLFTIPAFKRQNRHGHWWSAPPNIGRYLRGEQTLGRFDQFRQGTFIIADEASNPCMIVVVSRTGKPKDGERGIRRATAMDRARYRWR